jgi:UDP-N-acetylmuramate--alanine ligase
VLKARGVALTGSDSPEKFYTDGILAELGQPVLEGFSAENLPEALDAVVYSAAYDPGRHPELLAARERRLPILSYPEALGALSARSPSVAVTGVHGKSTTTALCGLVLKVLDMPVTVVVGTGVPGFDGMSGLVMGEEAFVVEACEYRRHFLHFRPRVIVLTTVEADHLDYFAGLDDIEAAFGELIDLLPAGGTLIYCADDPGAAAVARAARERRPSLHVLPYGKAGEGEWRVLSSSSRRGQTAFRLAGFDQDLILSVPGEHNVLNATAALAASSLVARFCGRAFDRARAAAAIEEFRGTRRRCEIVAEAGGVLIIDDYGHHPTAIAKTLEGLRSFYPRRRLIVDFMSHTYSRTAALMKEFAAAFEAADKVILHRIYASARERPVGGVSGETLYREVAARHGDVTYYPELEEALEPLLAALEPGDLFVTMGAGDNWRLGRMLAERLGERSE